MSQSYWRHSLSNIAFEKIVKIVINFLLTFFFIKHLSTYLFGLWSLYLIITSILKVTIIGITQKPMIKYLEDKVNIDLYNRHFTSITIIGFTLCIIIIAFILLFSDLIESQLSSTSLASTLIYFIPQVPFWLFFYLLQFSEQAQLKYHGTVRSELIYSLLFLISSLIIVYVYGIKKMPILIAGQFISLLCAVVYLFFKNYKYLPKRIDIELKNIWNVFTYSKYLAGTHLIQMLKSNLDSLLLSASFGPNAVGVYQIALKFLQLFQILNQTIAQAIFPLLVQYSRIKNSIQYTSIIEKTLSRIFSISFIPGIVLYFTSDIIIQYIGGFNYLLASSHIKILIAAVFIFPITYLFNSIIDSIGKSRQSFMYSILHMILIYITTKVCLIYFGEIGASVAMITSLVLIAIIYIVILNKTYKISLSNILEHTISDMRKLKSKITNIG